MKKPAFDKAIKWVSRCNLRELEHISIFIGVRQQNLRKKAEREGPWATPRTFGLMSMFAPTQKGHSPLFIDEFGQAKKKHKKAMAKMLLKEQTEHKVRVATLGAKAADEYEKAIPLWMDWADRKPEPGKKRRAKR